MYFQTCERTFGPCESSALPAAPPRGEVASPQSGWSSESGEHRSEAPNLVLLVGLTSRRCQTAHLSPMWAELSRQICAAEEEERARRELFGWVWSGTYAPWPGLARMGCTVSFICCEEDFLQMYQHEVEEKTKGNLTKVRSCGWRRSTWGLRVLSLGSFVCVCALNPSPDAVFVFMLTMDKD